MVSLAAAPQPPTLTLPHLTPREREVLALVAQGLTNSQIARDLGLQRRTVEWHLEQVFTRLGVKARAEAVSVASRYGLL